MNHSQTLVIYIPPIPIVSTLTLGPVKGSDSVKQSSIHILVKVELPILTSFGVLLVHVASFLLQFGFEFCLGAWRHEKDALKHMTQVMEGEDALWVAG